MFEIFAYLAFGRINQKTILLPFAWLFCLLFYVQYTNVFCGYISGLLTNLEFSSAVLTCNAIFQLYMGVDSVQILLEALVGFLDNFGYTIVYLLFLNGHNRITALIEDFNQFIQYSGIEIIRKTDEKVTKYTKCWFYC